MFGGGGSASGNAGYAAAGPRQKQRHGLRLALGEIIAVPCLTSLVYVSPRGRKRRGWRGGLCKRAAVILNNFQQSGIAPSAENAVKAMHGNSALGGKPFFFELNLALVKRPVFQFIPPRVKRSHFHN